jgi:hypothetical protein
MVFWVGFEVWVGGFVFLNFLILEFFIVLIFGFVGCGFGCCGLAGECSA